MSTDFSLKAEIKKVVDTTDLADPREIAAKVAENIPAKMLRQALAQALPELVRVELTRSRRPPTAPAPSAHSAKRTAIAEMWRRHLRDRVHIGQSGWLLLGDCSAENFRTAAAERRALAIANSAAAEKYDRYADACDEHGVDRFADLPEALQAELLQGEAA